MAEVAAEPLDPSHSEWGTVYVVPWDTDIFGFPVGTYTPGEPEAIRSELRAVGERLRVWAAAQGVELVSCTVPADDRAWRTLMPALERRSKKRTPLRCGRTLRGTLGRRG